MSLRKYAVVILYPQRGYREFEVRAKNPHAAFRQVETCEIEDSESFSVMPMKEWKKVKSGYQPYQKEQK